jgi:hypothetical protein
MVGSTRQIPHQWLARSSLAHPPPHRAGKVKLGPPPSSTFGKLKLDPPLLNGRQGQAQSTPSSTANKVKLGPTSSSGGLIFRASSSWCAKLVEVIDLISSDEDNDDVLSPPPSFRYEVGSDDEDSDDALPPPPSLPECHKRKALVADYNNKEV